MTTEVNIAPTREGQISMISLFGSQVIADIKNGRRGPDTQILESIVDLAFTLGHNTAREDALTERDKVVKAVTDWAL